MTIAVIAIVGGLFFGWLFFHSASGSGAIQEVVATGHDHAEQATVWTCSMHPQIRMDQPGQCPICGMDLIPLDETGSVQEAVSPDEIQMTETAMKIADVQTMPVQQAYPDKEISLLGKVKPDERNMAELTARFGGRIEKLFVNFTGQQVSKGEKLATIYSPALVTAQKELLEAMDYKESNPGFYRAARSKLSLWDLTEEQISNIEQLGEVQHYFDVLSLISGTVTKRHITLGDYVKEGSPLFQVMDLTHLWVMFDAYERDLPWIKLGDRVNFTVKSIPGKTFLGNVTFIDPVVDPVTRVARVRVELDNPALKLKPEMFADGMLISRIAGNNKALLIPKTAVLWTGKRSLVYVRVPGRDQPSFISREIELGPDAGKFYVVEKGLDQGEEIVVNGVFKIDASAQLAGKPSMMNPEGGKVSLVHDHGEMEMGSPAADHSGHVDRIMDPGKMTVDPVFRNQLTSLYDVYLDMKDAFVASDPEAVAKLSKRVDKALDQVNMNLLEGDAHMQWMDFLEILDNTLAKITDAGEIENQRAAFAEFNGAFYKSIKAFGLQEKTAYYQYCPMAIGEKGAYWFSSIKEIRNPYFGEAMMSCGETRETLEY